MLLNDYLVAMSEKQPWKFFAFQGLNFQFLGLNFQFLEGNFKISEPCVYVLTWIFHKPSLCTFWGKCSSWTSMQKAMFVPSMHTWCILITREFIRGKGMSCSFRLSARPQNMQAQFGVAN